MRLASILCYCLLLILLLRLGYWLFGLGCSQVDISSVSFNKVFPWKSCGEALTPPCNLDKQRTPPLLSLEVVSMLFGVSICIGLVKV